MTGSHVRSLATAATVDTVIVLINVSVIIAIKVSGTYPGLHTGPGL